MERGVVYKKGVAIKEGVWSVNMKSILRRGLGRGVVYKKRGVAIRKGCVVCEYAIIHA